MLNWRLHMGYSLKKCSGGKYLGEYTAATKSRHSTVQNIRQSEDTTRAGILNTQFSISPKNCSGIYGHLRMRKGRKRPVAMVTIHFQLHPNIILDHML